MDPMCTFDPDLWYADNWADQQRAKGMCLDCPLLQGCLETALAADERYGVWGGTTPADRDRIFGRNQGRRAAMNARRRQQRDTPVTASACLPTPAQARFVA